MIATNQMSKNTALSGASMEKLSTGLRITKAADDATGLAISEKMRVSNKRYGTSRKKRTRWYIYGSNC